ncbi:uncharacterized protein MELLADRAFT_112984 [Melampsora larici-populina 98AG31]|uniref:Uncharacterized protein n=1 Tax=Melampsora larici-populina (strain 98AG31 / pathotype 3-4-7) TaxID=747676 RepID=F4S8B5_MELLP|nr:uncharacterized protein MELLADRAFT_112984 [Melampsora larici-populina 98AG31]EGF99118.1 hypothetical protein MELLADRAFT_112984 [Melampsora larici-populina 98AG31]
MVRHSLAEINQQCTELLHLAPGTPITQYHIRKTKQIMKEIVANENEQATADPSSTSQPTPKPSTIPKRQTTVLASTSRPTPKPSTIPKKQTTVVLASTSRPTPKPSTIPKKQTNAVDLSLSQPTPSNYSARFDREDLEFVLDRISNESNQRNLMGAGSKTKVGGLSRKAHWNIFATLVNSSHNDRIRANGRHSSNKLSLDGSALGKRLNEIFGEKVNVAPGAIRNSMDLDAGLDDEDSEESSEHEDENILSSTEILRKAARIEELEDVEDEIKSPVPSLKEFDVEDDETQQHPDNLQDFLHANSPDFSNEIKEPIYIQPDQQALPPRQSIKRKAKLQSPIDLSEEEIEEEPDLQSRSTPKPKTRKTEKASKASKASKAVADQPLKPLPPMNEDDVRRKKPVANAMMQAQTLTMQFYNEKMKEKEEKEELKEKQKIVWEREKFDLETARMAQMKQDDLEREARVAEAQCDRDLKLASAKSAEDERRE